VPGQCGAVVPGQRGVLAQQAEQAGQTDGGHDHQAVEQQVLEEAPHAAGVGPLRARAVPKWRTAQMIRAIGATMETKEKMNPRSS